MNTELQKIESHLVSLGFSQKTFTELSKSNGGISLVTDNNTAFCFDDISNSFYKNKLSSADALLLRDNLYLIEFKPITSQLKSKSKTKQLKLKLFQKMAESFHTLRERIFIDSQVESSLFEKHFILVTEDARMLYKASIKRVVQKASKNPVQIAVGDIFEPSFAKYQQEYKRTLKNCSVKVYYDSVEILASSDFSTRIVQL